MLSPNKFDTYSQFLSRFKSQSKRPDSHSKMECTHSRATKPRQRFSKAKIFTEGISSYSTRQEYTIYEQNDAFVPAANLISGTNVSREKDKSVLIRRKSQVLGLVSDKTRPELETVLAMKLPVIHSIPHQNNTSTTARPGDDYLSNNLVKKANNRIVEKTDDFKEESETKRHDINSEKTSSEIRSKTTNRNNKRQKSIKTGKLIKIPLFQSMGSKVKKKRMPLSCALSYDISDAQYVDEGNAIRTGVNFNKLEPIVYQQPPRQNSRIRLYYSSKTRTDMYNSSVAEQLTRNGQKEHTKIFTVPPNPPPSAS